MHLSRDGLACQIYPADAPVAVTQHQIGIPTGGDGAAEILQTGALCGNGGGGGHGLLGGNTGADEVDHAVPGKGHRAGQGAVGKGGPGAADAEEIGRASCRERV